MVNAIHNIQAGTPVENIQAMIRAVEDSFVKWKTQKPELNVKFLKFLLITNTHLTFNENI